MKEGIPYGYCHCGCGQKTQIAAKSNKTKGLVKGEPRKFCKGHNSKVDNPKKFLGHERRYTYQSWREMKKRCLDKCSKDFKHYGGRGVKIYKNWMEFENFLADMGERPINTTLDRINCNGNYEPSNCKWSTQKEQQNNRRNNILVNHNGIEKSLEQLSKETGLKYGCLYQRLKKNWPIEKILCVK